MQTVRNYVIEKGIYSAEEVDSVEGEYKKFLALIIGEKQPMVMAEVIDPFWHAHLLFTKDYRQMCRDLGCGHIDHTPTTSPEERVRLTGGYNRTLSFYRKNFGEIPAKYWEPNGQICMGGDDGGGESFGSISTG